MRSCSARPASSTTRSGSRTSSWHKILDAVGDLALVGYPVIGHLVAHRAGHALHTEFAAKILEETHAWRLVEAPLDQAALPVGGAVKHAVPRLAN